MSYTLAAAAKATGLKKSWILKAIEDGRIAGRKDGRGEWRIERAALHRMFPHLAPAEAGAESNQQSPVLDVEAMGAQIEDLLRKAGNRLRQQLDHVRNEHDAAHDGAQELLPSAQYECATEKSGA
jgi:excisionase family DNA binding protein